MPHVTPARPGPLLAFSASCAAHGVAFALHPLLAARRVSMGALVAIAARDEEGPFATPGVPQEASAAFYCRPPHGRVHVPAADERRRFCVTGRHDLCPIYRRHARDD